MTEKRMSHRTNYGSDRRKVTEQIEPGLRQVSPRRLIAKARALWDFYFGYRASVLGEKYGHDFGFETPGNLVIGLLVTEQLTSTKH